MFPVLSANSSGYQIQRSLRFRSSASAYLARTPAVAGNRTTWTWSGWVKRGTFGGQQALFAAYGSGSSFFTFGFDLSTNGLQLYDIQGGVDYGYVTAAVFRDPSAWYSVVLCLDTTQATVGNRVKLYINGIQQAFTQNYGDFPQNYSAVLNYTYPHRLGSNQDAGAYLDGYLSEVNFIDGQALTPSSFGEISPTTGQWQAKKYSGTYGTNGFYLPFTDNSAATATAIGADKSGNGNNWTPNNISLTAGSTYDSMLDVPLGAGGAERGNYAVLNAVATNRGALTNGNLSSAIGAAYAYGVGTILIPSSGKWIFEVAFNTNTSNNNYNSCGVVTPAFNTAGSFAGSTTASYGISDAGAQFGQSFVQAGQLQGAITLPAGTVIQCLVDRDANTLTFIKNGTLQTGTGSTVTLPAGVDLYAVVGNYSISIDINFGQRPFAFSIPSGFKALHTGNLP